MTITLYGAPMTSASRVHWALEELAVPYEKSIVDLSKGAHKQPEFLKINPNGQVPALTDGDVTLFESAAIISYLGDKYGVAKGLWFAPGTADHAHAIQWMVWSGVSLTGALNRMLLNTSERIPEDARNAKAAAAGKESLHNYLNVLDGHLEGKHFIQSEKFTLVDVIVGTVVGYAAMVGADLSTHKNVAAWLKGINDRPARALSLSAKWA